MRKITTIFERDWEGDRSRVVDTPHFECAWVFAGEGVATRKWDGVCTMIRDGKLYKRFEAKDAHFAGIKPLPATWEPSDERDPTTRKQMGWVLVDKTNERSEDRWMVEALRNTFGNRHRDGGTYEFLGPKSQGNVEKFGEHTLVPHGEHELDNVPRTFEGLRGYLTGRDIEGIVFHHPDGRMAKIKGKDYGLKREAENG